MGGKPEQVRGDALQLAHHHADDLSPFRNFDAEHLLHGQHIAEVVVHPGEIVHPVGVVDKVLVTLVLAGLLEAGMQIAQIGVNIDDGLAVQLDHHAQHAVGAGVVGTHVDDHVLFAHARRQRGRERESGQNLVAQRLEFGVAPRLGEGDILAAQRHFLAQRVADPALGHEYAAQIGVAGKLDAHEVVNFPLGPDGALEDLRQSADRGCLAVFQRANDHQMLLAGVGAQLVDGLEAGVAGADGQL